MFLLLPECRTTYSASASVNDLRKVGAALPFYLSPHQFSPPHTCISAHLRRQKSRPWQRKSLRGEPEVGLLRSVAGHPAARPQNEHDPAA